METSGNMSPWLTEKNKVISKIIPQGFMYCPFKRCSGKKRGRIRKNREVYKIAKANLVLIY